MSPVLGSAVAGALKALSCAQTHERRIIAHVRVLSHGTERSQRSHIFRISQCTCASPPHLSWTPPLLPAQNSSTSVAANGRLDSGAGAALLQAVASEGGRGRERGHRAGRPKQFVRGERKMS